ncbi:DNA primase [Niallia circulans]|uniref:DNA primase n=1 Tax=Niallia TaxID=2837506 RepID=UPI000BA5F3EC|nr:DNA primase [Niallia circulans]PAD85899.1 DNA primase [Niallia circulans]PAE11768.1 DNA primase [Niallia circulans]
MVARIPEEKLNEIKQATDIVEIIGEHVSLTRQGRNFIGLCPFHGEKTPSFTVSPDKQIFHCFGCHAGGNVFTFLMDLEGTSFVEVATSLADRASIDLGIEINELEKKLAIPNDLQQMIDAHELLSKFYHHLLVNTKDGQHALEYLTNRGFTLPIIEKFQIGYTLNSWDLAVKFLGKRKFDVSLLEKAGLIVKSERDEKYFDRFRDRIIFPISDRNGNTIAFSGRALGDNNPKYLNSPETPIFNKSNTLYNFHKARPIIRKLQQAVLFEGFADVIAANRAGVENSVATMGTSLTEEHIAILKRNARNITICYDSDSAGIEAAFRAGQLLTKANCVVKVVMLPDGMDPDDYVNKFGEDKLQQEILHGSIPFMGFKMLYYRRGKNLQNEGDKLAYIEEVIGEIAKLDKAVEKDLYLRQLADEFSLSLEALKQQEMQMEQSSPNEYVDEKTVVPVKQYTVKKRAAGLLPAYHTAEKRLLAHMFKSEDIAYKVQSSLQGRAFNIDEHQAIFTYLLAFYEKGLGTDTSSFMNFIDDPDLQRIVAEIEMMEVNEEVSELEISDYMKQVTNYEKLLEIKEKKQMLKEAERQNDYIKAAQIGMEVLLLEKTLK